MQKQKLNAWQQSKHRSPYIYLFTHLDCVQQKTQKDPYTIKVYGSFFISYKPYELSNHTAPTKANGIHSIGKNTPHITI